MSSSETISWPPPESRVILTLLCDGFDAPLSPFYAWAQWIGVADVRGRIHALLKNPSANAAEVTRFILESNSRFVISGYIPSGESTMLLAKGLDVRIGPCSEPAVALVPRFQNLPKAQCTDKTRVLPKRLEMIRSGPRDGHR
jgi:hypothetical protein